MGARVSRRRYQELVRFLKTVIVDEKASIRVRMSAAARLDDLYARVERQQELEATRSERRERAEEHQRGKGGSNDPADTESLDESGRQEIVSPVDDRRIQGVFAEILHRSS